MALITAYQLSKSFDTEPLFEGLNFRVESNARIGLTGVNGSGKTTLFRLLTGELQPDSGGLQLERGVIPGYMEQQIKDAQLTLRQAVAEVFAPLMALEQEIEQVNERLQRESGPALLARQHSLQEELAARGGYTYRSRLLATLRGLGFREEEIELPLASLSGGQRSKALLARALLSEANLLLLDEPTNHLDISAMEWLEGFLAAFNGAFIIISHDRYFLDKLTTSTWELAGGRLYQYNGNYSASLQQKQAREDSLRHRQEQAKREARRVENMIEQQRRFNQARNYRIIANKQKHLARVEAEVERLSPLEEAASLDFHFTAPPPGGNEVLRLYDVAKGFGGRALFAHVELEINKGQRVFLLGPNGCGKTTLLKVILGQLTADSGFVKPGVNIHIGYFDQLSSGLDATRNILEEMTESYPKLTQGQIRGALGRFLFRGEEVFKPIAGLSGGEKARLTLLKLMLTPANFLILDEPSNHLDLASREAVEQALLDYPGAMLVVSHDRYLINKLAQRIYVLGAQGVQAYLGNYDDYLAKQAQLSAAAQPAASGPAAAEEAPGKGGQEYLQRKEQQSRLRKARHALQQAEQVVLAAEQALQALDEAISAHASDYQQLAELAPQREAAQAALDARYEEWAAAQTLLEELQRDAEE